MSKKKETTKNSLDPKELETRLEAIESRLATLAKEQEENWSAMAQILRKNYEMSRKAAQRKNTAEMVADSGRKAVTAAKNAVVDFYDRAARPLRGMNCKAMRQVEPDSYLRNR